MSVLDELRTLGVNVDEGLARINKNEKLYTRLLGTFVKSMEANAVSADFDDGDLTEMIEKTHTMKGTSGNLSITPLYEAYSRIVDLLRTGKPEEARPLLEEILTVQEKILQCIKDHM